MTKGSLQEFDVICPLYWDDGERLQKNIESWFREIPINRLLIGMANPNFKSKIEHPKIMLIDHTNYDTYGFCVADLMKRVETEWFIYVHGDVELTPYCFEIIKKYVRPDVGIIESERIHFDGKQYSYHEFHFRERAYAGFQMFRREVIETIVNRIEDDYVQSNEDIIFQNVCEKKGFKYIKSFAMHIHQVIGGVRRRLDDETIQERQWRGLVKYSNPTYITCNGVRDNLSLIDNNIEDIRRFINENNKEWSFIVDEIRKVQIKMEV